MRRKICILSILICIVMGLKGCIVVKNQSSASYTIINGKEITDSYSYVVKDDFNGMKLSLQLLLEEGEVSFELKDPNGDVQWSDTIDSKTPFNEEKKFENITGKWLLNFSSIDNNASGTIELQFNGNN